MALPIAVLTAFVPRLVIAVFIETLWVDDVFSEAMLERALRYTLLFGDGRTFYNITNITDTVQFILGCKA